MHPELFTIPFLGLSVKTYGFCMMVGFLSAVWLSMRRAQRVKADPDRVLDMAFLALIFGVGGARVFYVVHYWQSQFAGASNRLLAVIDITEGGLEFLGGFLGATVAIMLYALRAKVSIRLYLDVLAPGAMWGLAFGRLGCFFNGCCFGGLCVVSATGQPAYPWAVNFPFASPAHSRQWENREVTVPAELVGTDRRLVQPWLLPASMLTMSVQQREGANRQYQQLKEEYDKAQVKAPNSEETKSLEQAVQEARKKKDAQDKKLIALRLAQRYPSRSQPTRRTSVSELEMLASNYRSFPVHPTQLYSALNAMLLSAVLSNMFYIRKRHGVVIASLFLLYPISRVILELIRTDNPHDVGGLTVSQGTSLGMFALGVVALVILYRRLPERSGVLELEPANNQAD